MRDALLGDIDERLSALEEIRQPPRLLTLVAEGPSSKLFLGFSHILHPNMDNLQQVRWMSRKFR